MTDSMSMDDPIPIKRKILNLRTSVLSSRLVLLPWCRSLQMCTPPEAAKILRKSLLVVSLSSSWPSTELLDSVSSIKNPIYETPGPWLETSFIYKGSFGFVRYVVLEQWFLKKNEIVDIYKNRQISFLHTIKLYLPYSKTYLGVRGNTYITLCTVHPIFATTVF